MTPQWEDPVRYASLILGAVALSAVPAFAMSNGELRAALEKRFKNDRTGACVAAAVIENGRTSTAYVCANPAKARAVDERTAFEIGSVSKTMTAALLAEMILRGEAALSDPLAKLLPPGTKVPSYHGRQITLADIVTHTSGLPSIPPQWPLTDLNNPYVRVSERELLGALSATALTRAPGTQWEYSNFAMMALSYAIAKKSGRDFETLLRERLLAPLGMNDSYIAKRPPQVRIAPGHQSNTLPASPWDFAVDMAGVGGVRATLPDMVRYVEAQLGLREAAITPALAKTQAPVATVTGGPPMAINWIIAAVNGRTLHVHDGGTGGFSASVGFDRAGKRGYVLLSDTSLTEVGGFASFGPHLLDPSVPAGAPRLVATPDPKLIEALVGRYRLQSGLLMELRKKGSALTIQATGQSEFEMGYDSAGDFYALQFDASLRPTRKADGSYTFTWSQLGGAQPAERIGAPPPSAALPAATEAELKSYEGNYPLAPDFALKVFVASGKLFVQGTGQGPLEIVRVAIDVFVAESVGAEITFERDAGGKVTALTLKQAGQVLRGGRH
jgi:CubicO group peptidase (beta-lactamase class C family)